MFSIQIYLVVSEGLK